MIDSPYGQQLHPWARIQAEALDRLARFTKTAINCGVEASVIRYAERQGAELARVLTAVLDELELTDEQRAALPGVLRKHLLGIEGEKNADIVSGAGPDAEDS